MTASREVERGKRLPRLHVVTEDTLLERPDFLEVAARLLTAGGPEVALHLRSRTGSGGSLFRLAERLTRYAADSGALLLVNDRIDVALACGAAGVQLGSASFPIAAARELLGPGRWVGASVHTAAEAARAVREGADFVLAGTLYTSTSHPGRPPTGPGWLRSAAALGAPVIGIGGVTAERVAEVLAHGGHGVAVIRSVWAASDPVAALRAFLQELTEPDER